MNASKQWLFIKLIIFYCLLSSARACCTLGDNPYIDMVASFFVLFYFSKKKYFTISSHSILASIIILIGIMWTMHGTSSLVAYPGAVMFVLIPCLLINTRYDIQIDIFNSLTRWLAILLSLSFFWWILHFFVSWLPHLSSIVEYDELSKSCVVNNYFLFQDSLDFMTDESTSQYLRFGGVFLEPGHLGTICVTFLFANKFDFSKFYNLIILFCLIVSASAAAYVLFAIGLGMKSFIDRNFKWFFCTIILLLFMYTFFSQFNNGDNVINNQIIDKLFNPDRGLDERFNMRTDAIYNRIWDDDSFITGLGNNVQLNKSAGYKVFIIKNGILGAFFVLLGYYLIYHLRKSAYAFCFFLLMFISFLQRVYCYWDAFLDPFILGVTYMYYSKRSYGNH